MKYSFIILFLFSSFCIQAQIVSGEIVDSTSSEKIPGALIQLINTEKNTVSGRDGAFSIEGEGRIRISCLGYISKIVTADKRFLTVKLTPDTYNLQTVEIVGRAAKNYNSEYSFAATKVAAKNKDIPLGISTITKELIADRQAFQLADAVKIASGVIPSSHYNQYSIRGLSQNEEGQILNGMRTRQYYFNQPLTANIERVEVIKGPASATFSSVDPGGSINLVTKKPLSLDKKAVSISVGSFSTMRSTLDFTGPLNDDKTLLYRLNGAYQESAGFRDLDGQKALLISPSFSYIPNSKTAINVEFIYSHMDGKLDRGQPIFGAIAGVTDLNSTPITFNMAANNDYLKSKEVIVMGNIAHKFTDAVSFNISYMKQTWAEDLFEHRTTNAFAVDINNNPVPTLASMQAVQRQQFWNIDNVNSYLNYDFKTGSVSHKLLFGYDLHSWHKVKGGGQNAARGYLLKDGSTTNAYDPERASGYQTISIGGIELPKPNVDHFNLTDPQNTIKNTDNYVFTKSALPAALTTTNALYIQEQLTWNKFMLLLSLRQEWFQDITNYDDDEIIVKEAVLLPRIGLTYAAHKNFNIYGTYLIGYQPQSNTVTLLPVAAPQGSTFDPIESDLKELGLKTTLFNGAFQVNIAFYEINQRNLLMNANDATNTDLLVTRGAERSRGFETDVAGHILPNWQVNASYSYIDATIEEDSDPSLIGARKQNTPYNSLNFWTRYNLESLTLLKDLGIGLGIQHNGSSVPWFTRAFKIPGYTLLDLALYYTPYKSNIQLAVNVNNVMDKTHWIGAQNYLRLFPGTPRNILITATYKF